MNATAPLLLLLVTAACVASGALLPKSVVQFGATITCYQPGINPLKYDQYGCFCGFGSMGTPLDDLDRCCKGHDECYTRSQKIPGCTSENPLVLVYDYKCSNRRVTCSSTNNKCQAAVCECDRVAAECFARNEYNPEYKNLDKDVYCSN